MTNLMTSLGNQVIKILPSWCFKEAQTDYSADIHDQLPTNLPQPSMAEFLGFREQTREELKQLIISQNQMLTEREDELFEMQKEETSIFKVRINWLAMYLIGIVTGAMGLLLYQVLQSNYNLV